MKNTIIILLLLVTVFSSGCDDKEAREYAQKMIPVLDSYQEQLSQKIKVEKESYNELADTYDEARKKDIILRLTNERRRRAELAADKLINSKDNISLLSILDSLQDYAKSDFETTQTLLQEELNTRSQYLTNLESLEIELQKIKSLKEALQELAKGKSDFKKFKQSADFVLKTDEEINKLLCVDLNKQLEQLNTELKDANGDEKTQIEKQIQRLKERMKTKKCS